MKASQSFTDDFQLWQAFKSGREDAFDHIYDNHFARLYGYGTRLCSDKSLVKDCIQNLFLELLKNRENLAEVQSIKHYLYTSFRRKLFKELEQERKYMHPNEPNDDYHFEVTFSHERFLMSEEVNEENQSRLLKAFQLLTKRQKEAVFLRFYESLEYPEIAEIMALKEVKYARTLVYRALDVLRSCIRKLASIQ